jgi:hypothetical protein
VTRLMRRRLPIVCCTFALLLAVTAPALASTRTEIYRDCQDDSHLQGSYTSEEIREARQNMPSDIAEYSDCSDVLRRAELAGTQTPDAGGTGGPSTGGTGGPPSAGGTQNPPQPQLVPESDSDKKALADAALAPTQPVTVGGEDVLAGVTPLSEGYRANDMPATLLVALILLALAGLALCLPPLRRRALPLLRRG